MAIQAQIYSDNNLGIPFLDHRVGVSFSGLVNNDDIGFNLPLEEKYGNPSPQLLPHHQQQQQQYPSQSQHQQQYFLLHQQQLQWKNQFQDSHHGNFVFCASKNTPTISTPIKNNTHISNNVVIGANNNNMSTKKVFSQTIIPEMEKQSLEIDRAINFQSQRLKSALQQQRKQQLTTIIQSIESKASILLHKKDEQITEFTKRTMELQDLILKIDNENQGWKRINREKEATITNLNSTLQQLREATVMGVGFHHLCNNNEYIDDAESCCEDEQKLIPTGKQNVKKRMRLERTIDDDEKSCRSCGNSCVVIVFMPCRHLCSCRKCEPILDVCPVCKSAKQGTIEAIII